ncbi:GCN5 family acetyltransferase [Paenibacillus sp. FSL R7-0273]|uniref:GNAT family N-acetyltransferase n=1 Tax=Paenibacillus sp. FSL R7-0273 TaxID=1536772 RepID=UPI0004F650DD|nr:N-acetyltransferase [Paenibacillus sp. FSL R7-0273]AIQ48428.1 GCN5 family acetyltransferase [Paenibacillus sp. FSL R7-0273]OMF88424.1 GNAT family N-acetyltransferase [Paenibacillus sp. FSL R7-0273]
MQIRTEKTGDYGQVFRLNELAFGNREDEAELLERIRHSDQFIPDLSIVAERKGMIVGHILLSGAKVVDKELEHPVIVLAPIAVHPEYQGRGIGGLLIEEAKRRAASLGFGAILLIGHPSYYPRFGFVPAGVHGLELLQFPVPAEVFQVCVLREGALEQLKGELMYPAAFF